MTTKITKKDNFNSLIELATTADRTDLVEFLNKEIAALDKKAAKAKAVAAEKKTANDAIKMAIATVLTDEFASINDIITKMPATVGDEEITVGKVRYRLTKMVESGDVERTEASIKEEGKKARKEIQYRLTPIEN